MQEEILDANQVAELLKIKYRTVIRMADRGDLPGFRVGDLWRFRRTDIEAYIDEKLESRKGERHE